jgi:hypothetical protein
MEGYHKEIKIVIIRVNVIKDKKSFNGKVLE